MKLSTSGRLTTVLLLIAAVAISATGCVFIPYPVGDSGHHHYHRGD